MAKIKMKSHKASKRRIRLSPRGKIIRTQCGVRHLLAGRSPKRTSVARATRCSKASPSFSARSRADRAIGDPSGRPTK